MGFIPEVVVIPGAGRGTRVKNLSKDSCKEMLLYNDLPLIEHAIYEAAKAGFKRIVVVTHKSKNQLNQFLSQFPKVELVYQEGALGLGHAVLCTRSVIKDSSFAILLPDGVPSKNVFSELVKVTEQHNAPGVAVMSIPKELVSNYGIIDPVRLKPTHGRIKGIVEKPDMDVASSNLGIIGRYIVDQGIFTRLELARAYEDQELELTPYLRPDSVYWLYEGKFWDGGDVKSYE